MIVQDCHPFFLLSTHFQNLIHHTMSLEIKSSPSFTPSAFPKRAREAEDTDNQNQTIKLPHLCSIPQYIKLIYGVSKVEGIEKEFNFLNRDNVVKEYEPSKEDPFVFKGRHSISQFHESAKKLIKVLVDSWKNLGLPTTQDKDRSITIPDTDKVVQILLNEDPAKSKNIAKFMEVRHDAVNIGSNIDIMKKACLVRSVGYGWWIVSYRGKNTKDLAHFAPALRILSESFKVFRSSGRFKTLLDETINDQGDPLDTNIGYPLYSAEVNDAGQPIARLKMIDMFSGLGKKGYDYAAVIEEISRRVQDPVLARYPFAISSIRRQQPGYKWNHVWTSTSAGLRLTRDERGNTTNRVAFNASYLQNQLLSPVQSEWKTFRKMIPGIFFDGSTKKEVLNFIKSSHSIVFESDFSNYDRSIPNNLASSLFAIYSKLTKHPNYYYQLLKGTHSHLPLIWPEWIPGRRGNGWIFWVDELALLSGLKITAEVGTFVNLIVIMQSVLDSGVMSQTDLFKYITRNSNQRSAGNDVLFLIQSDDTMFCHKDLKVLQALTNSFISNAKFAGLKGSLELGDRFLMRHMTDGADRPLSSRVWQNTLSNESGYTDPLKFIVGLCARTDGMLGLKSVDPFGTGKIQSITLSELNFAKEVLKELFAFLSTAAAPVTPAVEFIKTLLRISERMRTDGKSARATDNDLAEVTNFRNKFSRLLAERELESIRSKSKLYETYLYSLHKNALSPTSANMLESITSSSSVMAQLLQQVEGKEHQFYVNSMKALSLSVNVD